MRVVYALLPDVHTGLEDRDRPRQPLLLVEKNQIRGRSGRKSGKKKAFGFIDGGMGREAEKPAGNEQEEDANKTEWWAQCSCNFLDKIQNKRHSIKNDILEGFLWRKNGRLETGR
jgi:hypothetical protein